MPYHPPQQDAFTDILRWFLVAVPDKPEYIRAAEGAYTELTKYWMWDGEVGDANAAADSWDEAVDETLRALEMGFPDTLLGHIDEVETLLRQIAGSNDTVVCCPDVPGADTLVSDVPANLETSTTDVAGGTFPDGMTQSEFETYLCNAATAYVDKLIELPDDAVEIFQTGFATVVTLIVVFTTGAYIGIAGAIAGVVTVTTILNAIGILEDIIKGITDGTEDNPTVPSQEMLDAKQSLVCAITQANDAASAASALRNAIGDAVTSIGWTNLLLLWPHETLLAKVFNGDTTEAPAAVCNCADPVSFTHVTGQAEMAVDFNGWVANGASRIQSTSGACGGDWVFAFPGNTNVQCTDAAAASAEGVTLPSPRVGHIQQVRMNVCHIVGSWRIEVFYNDTTSDVLTGSGTGLITFTPPNRDKEITENPTRCVTIASGSTGFHTNLIEVDYYIEEGVT